MTFVNSLTASKWPCSFTCRSSIQLHGTIDFHLRNQSWTWAADEKTLNALPEPRQDKILEPVEASKS